MGAGRISISDENRSSPPKNDLPEDDDFHIVLLTFVWLVGGLLSIFFVMLATKSPFICLSLFLAVASISSIVLLTCIHLTKNIAKILGK